MQMTRERQVEAFVPFILSAHYSDLLNVLGTPQSDQQYYGVRISMTELAAHSPRAAEQLLRSPRQVRRLVVCLTRGAFVAG